MKDNPNKNQMQYMPIGMCLGMSIGAGLGVALGNLALYMCVGISVGMCIGSIIDARHRADAENAEKSVNGENNEDESESPAPAEDGAVDESENSTEANNTDEKKAE